MDAVQKISRTDLPSQAQHVLDAVHQGETAVIERNGEPEAAILDLVDYRILRAAARFLSEPADLERRNSFPSEKVVARFTDAQDRYDLVIGRFLAKEMSLSRAAELLGTTYIELRLRLGRLGLPTYQGSATIEEAREEVRVAESIGRSGRTEHV